MLADFRISPTNSDWGLAVVQTFSCLWVKELPKKIYKEHIRTLLGTDLTQAEVNEIADKYYREHPVLDPSKERVWGMLVEIERPASCARLAFSRSASNRDHSQGIWHQVGCHQEHGCKVVTSDALIQLDLASGHSFPIHVGLFLRLGAASCNRESLEVVGRIQNSLKNKFPQRHICFSGGAS